MQTSTKDVVSDSSGESIEKKKLSKEDAIGGEIWKKRRSERGEPKKKKNKLKILKRRESTKYDTCEDSMDPEKFGDPENKEVADFGNEDVSDSVKGTVDLEKDSSIEKKTVSKKGACDGDLIKKKKGACGKDSIEKKKWVKESGHGDPELLFFDFETTDLSRDSHIIHIGAVRGKEEFEKYVRPKRPISFEASQVNGITYKDGVMRRCGEEVHCVGIKRALKQFRLFISANKKGSILVGHYIKNFACKVLYHAVFGNKLMKQFLSVIKGCIDIYYVFKKVYKKHDGHSLDKLHERHFDTPRAQPHDALSDAQLIKKLYELIKSNPETQKSLFSWKSVVCVCSLQPLVRNNILSQYMAGKLAKIGLEYGDLLKAHKHPSSGGISLLFSEKVGENRKPRVTNKKAIIKQVSDYFDKTYKASSTDRAHTRANTQAQ
ncbi:hypothetical protein SNE40_020188 [Patella caerulea]